MCRAFAGEWIFTYGSSQLRVPQGIEDGEILAIPVSGWAFVPIQAEYAGKILEWGEIRNDLGSKGPWEGAFGRI
jgi:hypothetical protein